MKKEEVRHKLFYQINFPPSSSNEWREKIQKALNCGGEGGISLQILSRFYKQT